MQKKLLLLIIYILFMSNNIKTEYIFSNESKQNNNWNKWLDILKTYKFKINKDLLQDPKYQGTYNVISASAGMYYPFTTEGTLRITLKKNNIKLQILSGGTNSTNVFYFNIYEIGTDGKLKTIKELNDFDITNEGFVKKSGSEEERVLKKYRDLLKNIINNAFAKLQKQLKIDKKTAREIITNAF